MSPDRRDARPKDRPPWAERHKGAPSNRSPAKMLRDDPDPRPTLIFEDTAAADLPEALRAILRPILPDRAFLRRARGDVAFVTDAPRHLSDEQAPALLSRLKEADFLCRAQGGLLLLSPGPRILTSFEAAHPDPPDFLCASLARFRGRPPCPEALTLFAVGVRLLEHPAPGERRAYERRARQLAALCLREDLGGVYACALIAHLVNDPPA